MSSFEINQGDGLRKVKMDALTGLEPTPFESKYLTTCRVVLTGKTFVLDIARIDGHVCVGVNAGQEMFHDATKHQSVCRSGNLQNNQLSLL